MTGQPVGAAYLKITNSIDATVVNVGSDAASVVELHTMQQDSDVMLMRQVPRLQLPVVRPVKLAPGGTHVMLLGLKRPLRAGESVVTDLTVNESDGRRRTVRVNVPVRASAPGEGAR